MRLPIALLSALCNSVLAQDVVTAYLHGMDQTGEEGSFNFTPVVSIKSSSSSTTIMSLGCKPGILAESCVVGSGFNYTIFSSNTYIGAWTMTELPAWSMGFTCVHNAAATEVICGEEKSDNGQFGYMTGKMVYEAVAADFITATIVGGRNKLQATAVPVSVSATPASVRPTGSGVVSTPTASVASAQSTGDAPRFSSRGSTIFALAAAALVVTWQL